MLTARDSLTRRSELARLAVADIEWRGAGDARAILRRTKGDAEGRSVWLAPETCVALRAWLARAGLDAGPVFRKVHSDGRVGDGLLAQTKGFQTFLAIRTEVRAPSPWRLCYGSLHGCSDV